MFNILYHLFATYLPYTCFYLATTVVLDCMMKEIFLGERSSKRNQAVVSPMLIVGRDGLSICQQSVVPACLLTQGRL